MQANGNFVGLDLKEVILMLGTVKKDGCLSISGETKGGEVMFSSGKVVNVSVDGEPDWTEVLFNEGLIGKDILKMEKDTGLIKNLRSRLSDQGEAVEVLTKYYVDEIYSIISLKDVNYQFEACDIKSSEASGVEVEIGAILSGIERCEEEWRRVYHVIPALSSYADMSSEVNPHQEITLTPDEWRLLLNLREPQAIESLKSKVGLPTLSLCKKLIDLHSRGLVRFLAADSEEVKALLSNNKGKYIKKSKDKAVPLEWSNYYEQLDEKAAESKGKTKVAN